MNHQGKLYMRPSELAERWCISEKKLANDRCAGRGLPYMKVNQVVLYALADVRDFELANRVEMSSVGRRR